MPRPCKESTLDFIPQIEYHGMAQGDHVSLNFDDIECKHSMKEEKHNDKKCICKKRRLKQNGHIVYAWYRICYCGKTDRKREYDKASNGSKLPNYSSMDGIDIHYDDECAYSTEGVGWCYGHYKFVLYCYCHGQPKLNARR